MSNYFSKLDEIDKWLFDSFGILPGACSSTENLRHTTARMVAEVLWPKKDLALTKDDVKSLIEIWMNLPDFPARSLSQIAEETLDIFNGQRNNPKKGL